MTSYQILQCIHVVIAGVLVGLFARVTRRRAAHPVRRYGLLLLSFGSLVVLGFVIAPFVPVNGHLPRFVPTAWAFWGCALWGPLIFVVGAWRAMGRVPSAMLGLSVLVLAGAGWALFIEPDRVALREERIVVFGLSEGRPIRIAHVSDLQTVGACARERHAVELVNGAAPDLVIVTGDHASGPFWNPDPPIEAARAFLAALKPRLGTVVVSGHSDSVAIRREIFAGLEVIDLDGRSRRFELEDGRGVVVHGIGIEHVGKPEFRGGLRRPGDLVIVASHMPDITEELSGMGVHLHLAGHTHGGQIVLPLFGPPVTLSRLPRRFARGLHRFGDHWINVTAGIGLEGGHAPRVRFLCPPEVCVIRLSGS